MGRQNLHKKLGSTGCGNCIHAFGQRGEMDHHRLGFCGTKAAIEIPEVHALWQCPSALTANIFTHLVLDRLQNTVSVFAFNGKWECFFHAAIMRGGM